MLKVAVLDDYQNIFSQIINLDEYKSKYEFTIFNEPFQNELETIEALKGFEALFIMRERTKITKTLISNLPKLKFIMTSGCLLYTSPSPRDLSTSRMPSSA